MTGESVAIGHDASSDPATRYLTCPRCGLTLQSRSRWLTVRHCPRCIARSHIAIQMRADTAPDATETATAPMPDTTR